MRFNTMALLQKLSSSIQQGLALASLLLTLFIGQQAQAQSTFITPEVVAGSLTSVTSTTNTFAVPRPVGLAVGDLILVNISSRTQAATYTASGTSAGFVSLGTSSAAGTSTTIAKTTTFYKIATAAEVTTNATYTFTVGGIGTNRGHFVTAVRVRAGTFNATTPITIPGSVSTATSTVTAVNTISVPQLTGLPTKAVLMGFHATHLNTTNTTTPSGMSALNDYDGTTALPAQLLATQTFSSGGNTGAKDWSWTTAQTAAGMIYAINPASVLCNDITGALTSTTGGTFSIGTNATVTLQGNATLIRNGVTYTITYNLSGANSGTYTASATTNGSLSFVIPATAVTCEGATNVTITAIQVEGCPTPLAINTNNTATVNMIGFKTPQVDASSLTSAGMTFVNSSNIFVALPRPIGLQVGDMILVNASCSNQSGTLTNPNFTLIGSSTSGVSTTVPKTIAFYKIATAADVSSPTYNFTVAGNLMGLNFYVTAVRVVAGTFNSSTPIVGFTTALQTSSVDQITVPQLSALPANSMLMGFQSTASPISFPSAPSGMSTLNINTAPGQLLANQAFPFGGNSGSKTWSWTTSSTAAGIMYALNPTPISCNSISGSLSSTTTADYSVLGDDAVVEIQGNSSLLQLGATYTITYNLSGANNTTGLTATAIVTTTGSLSFNVPSSVLTNLGVTSLSITTIQGQGCCLNPVNINTNNTALLNIICGTFSSNAYTAGVNTQGVDQSVVFYLSSFIPGTYTVTYDLSGANTATGATATMLVSGSVASFNIPAALLTNTGLTNLSISSISAAPNCLFEPVAPLSFTVQANNNPYSGSGPGSNCGYSQIEGQTCANTNFGNAFMASWDDPMTIEYDNFTSLFHSTLVRTSDGSFSLWGESAENNGVDHVLSPKTLDATNYPALGSHKVLKVTGGSEFGAGPQFIALTTDGLYAWGKEDQVLKPDFTTSTVFAKVAPIDGNNFSLPPGVSPSDVKMMQAGFRVLCIVTCDGQGWMLVNNNPINNNFFNNPGIAPFAAVRGDGKPISYSSWARVSTSLDVPLTDIIAIRYHGNNAIALRADNTLWTWGQNSYIGNSTAPLTRSFATQMVNPSPTKTIKMIGVMGLTVGEVNSTPPITANPNASYHVLMTDGNLYSLGDNTLGIIGDWTSTERRSWVQPRYNSSAGPVMNNIHWISPQEHDAFFKAINVLTKDAVLYAWGANHQTMLGGAGANIHPTIPSGLTNTDVILSVETGGHTSMITKKCDTKFGYVGHRVNGSMGNGSAASLSEPTYTFATADVPICAAGQPAIDIFDGATGIEVDPLCNETSYPVTITPPGGTLTVVSGPATLSGLILTTTGEGTVTLQYVTPASVCGTSQTITKTFIVAPPTLITNPVGATYCINAPATALVVTATGTNNTLQWYSNTTASNTGGTAIPGATGSSYTPPTGTAGTFYYYVIVTGDQGVCPKACQPATVIVDSANTASSNATSTVCVNAALSPAITHSTTGAIGIGVATGLPAGLTASWAANTITISGTPTATGTFNYSIPLIGGCGPVSATGTITVNVCTCANPPTVTITGDNDVCTGNTITLTGTFTNATNATWSIVSGGGSLSTTACGTSPCTTVYTPGATGTVVIRLTTDDPDGAGPCTAVQSEHIIIVRRVPVLGPVQRN